MLFNKITNKLGGYNGLREKYFKTNSSLMKRFYSFINNGYQHETNSYLPFDNVINGPINFLHGTYGVFISGSAKIGANCTIYHQVTIGSNMLVDSKGLGSPTIGANCLIGAGAKIIGKVNIGNNCRIGSNTVVTSDLPDNSVIVLAVPRVFQKESIQNNVYQKGRTAWGYRENGVFVVEKNPDIIARLESL